MKRIIHCEGISKRYGKDESERYVLKDVNLDVAEGEFVAITGRSGSGKSSLMYILGLLDNDMSGKYEFDGQDVSGLSEDQLADLRWEKIGFVFQDFKLLKRNVFQNVKLPFIYGGGRIAHEIRDEMVEKALISAGLPENLWEHLSNQLSGGQMQRVAIARALVNNPSVILADEPTGNLDSESGKFILDTLEKLNKDGRTVIVVTHEPYVAERAKRVVSVRDGRVVENEDEESIKLGLQAKAMFKKFEDPSKVAAQQSDNPPL